MMIKEYNIFYLKSKTEIVIKENEIDDVFELV